MKDTRETATVVEKCSDIHGEHQGVVKQDTGPRDWNAVQGRQRI